MALPITITSVGQMLLAQPLMQSATAIASAQLALHLGQAEALVWGYTSKKYTTPIDPCPPLLESICIDLAVYGVLVKQAILANSLEQSPWPDRYKESLDLLKEIAMGNVPLVTASATSIAMNNETVAFASPKYQPIFTDLGFEYAKIDPDKISDLLASRK